jgi:fluoride exporter
VQRQQIDPAPPEPVDTDVDLHSGRPARHRASDAVLLAVIAVGCAIGASARYLIGEAWPTPQGGFLWATLAINVSGCALICVLMVVTDVLTRRRRLRPFLGTGVLGGCTTFSAYAVDIQRLIADRHSGTALLYLAVTAAGY